MRYLLLIMCTCTLAAAEGVDAEHFLTQLQRSPADPHLARSVLETINTNTPTLDAELQQNGYRIGLVATLCKSGNLAMLEAALANGAKLDMGKRNEGLSAAARRGRVDMLQALADAGVSFDLKDRAARNLFSDAYRSGSVDTVRWLVAKGLLGDQPQDVLRDAFNGSDETMAVAAVEALDYATLLQNLRFAQSLFQTRHGSLRLLAAQHVPLTGEGRHAEDLQSSIRSAILRGGLEIIEPLKQRGYDPLAGRGGIDILRDAAGNRDIRLVQALLARGVPPNPIDEKQQPPLMAYRQSGGASVSRALLLAGADPNVSYRGESPIHQAASAGDLAMVTVLLDHGANIDTTDQRGLSAHALARMTRHELVAEALLARGAKPDLNTVGMLSMTPRQTTHTAPLTVGEILDMAPLADDQRRAALELIIRERRLDLLVPVLGQLTPAELSFEYSGRVLWELLWAPGGEALASVYTPQACAELVSSSGLTPLVSVLGARDSWLDGRANSRGDAWQALTETGAWRDALLAAGADPNMETPKGSPAAIAIHNNDVTSLEALFNNGLRIDYATPEGHELLIAATNYYRLGALRVLLKQGALTHLPEASIHRFVSTDQAESLAMALTLIEAGVPVDMRNDNGHTPLQHAARNGSEAALAPLILAGADINARTDLEGKAIADQKPGHTALIGALERRSSNAARVLLDHKASLALSRGPQGETPLWYAARMGDAELCQRLITDGDDVHAVTTVHPWRKDRVSGETALHAAARQRDSGEVVALLLKAGIDPALRNSSGETAQDIAAAIGNATAVTAITAATGKQLAPEAEAQIQAAALFNARKDEALIALATEHPEVIESAGLLAKAVMHRRSELVAALAPLSTNIDAPDERGYTPLILAVERGDLVMLDAILAAKPAVSRMVEPGHVQSTSALHAAVGGSGGRALRDDAQRSAIVARLLAAGADPNRADTAGNTVLLLAVQRRCEPAILEQLITGGAQAKTKNNSRRGALDFLYSYPNNTTAVLDLLVTAGASLDPQANSHMPLFHQAAMSSDPGLAPRLIELGLDPSVKDNEGRFALGRAAAQGPASAVANLLATGADPAAVDSHGWTARHHLEWRATRGYGGADNNAAVLAALDAAKAPATGISPIYWQLAAALERSRPGQLEKLLAEKPDLAAWPEILPPPAWSAARLNQPDVLKQVLALGAKADVAEPTRGSTPLHEAARHGSGSMTHMLLDAGANPARRNDKGQLPVDLIKGGVRGEIEALLNQAQVKPDQTGGAEDF
ncbi:MAG: ankyrin repeat domain-containing protein [Planctomycetota bacterium]|jgi:ankyrin repeat protein|nr:ankyrin repeat domain-containing protein [Planctomycetota bacterium]